MTPREKLVRWVKTLPYPEHALFVAQFAKSVKPFGYETGLCHDVFENTGMRTEQLSQKFLDLGYGTTDAAMISDAVRELTSVYAKAAYSGLSKKERHRLEDERLAGCSAVAQSVKYGDIVDNACWMALHKPEKLNKYLRRKLQLLKRLDKGDPNLLSQAIQALIIKNHNPNDERP